MEEKEVRKRLMKRVKNIYEKTETMIRTRDGYTRSFTKKKEIRQRCMLSPSLFNLYIVDLDRELAKSNIKGITLRAERKIMVISICRWHSFISKE